DELRIKFDSGAADNVTTLNWNDTWRFSLGGTFKPMTDLELRAGVAFDESPIPDNRQRTPRIPGADRFWVTLGAGYQVTDTITVDLAYGHLFVDDPKIDKDVTEAENRLRGALVGEFDASVDIVSAAVSFQF
ncbi:MAG: outer membrane protein transport protein, partial [Desulfosarcina sp.]